MLGMAPDYDSLTIVQKVGVTARQLRLRADYLMPANSVNV